MRSDLARVDAHVIRPEEYDELPDLADADLADGVLEIAGRPVRGRPALGAAAKRAVSLRLDPDVVEHFKAGGPGWQSRMNAVLRLSMERRGGTSGAVAPSRPGREVE